MAPTPVFLSGQFHGQRSLASYSWWGHKVLKATEHACILWHHGFVLLIFLKVSVKQIMKVGCILASFIQLCLWNSHMLLYEAIFIHFYCYNIFLMNKPKLIHPTGGGHWVLWTLWILWIVVLWTFVYILWGTNFCWLYCQGVELQGHKVCLCSFSKMVLPV